jgi:hypothetical protein
MQKDLKGKPGLKQFKSSFDVVEVPLQSGLMSSRCLQAESSSGFAHWTIQTQIDHVISSLHVKQ